MKTGDLVAMNFELPGGDFIDDAWGIGVIVELDDRYPDDACVFWSLLETVSWDDRRMLEVVQ